MADASRAWNFSRLVLAGGGPKVLCYVGCLQFLEDVGMLAGMHTFIGTSAGAILCTMLALGMSSGDIVKMLQTFRKDRCHVLDVDRVFMLPETFGVDDASRIVEFLERMLRLATGHQASQDLTFLEFAKITGKDLVVCASNLTSGEHEFFCVEKTPMVPVVMALRMSFAIPVIFTPVQFEGALYVDGGILNNRPIDYQSQRCTEHVDTLALVVPPDIAPPTRVFAEAFMSYIAHLVMLLIKRSNAVAAEDKDERRTKTVSMTFPAGADDMMMNVIGFSPEDMSFDVSEATLAESIRRGYDTIKRELHRPPPRACGD